MLSNTVDLLHQQAEYSMADIETVVEELKNSEAMCLHNTVYKESMRKYQRDASLSVIMQMVHSFNAGQNIPM